MSESETVELPPTETTQPAPLDLLELNFTDECWLVVTDAQGDVLVTDLIQPGRELNLQGQAPFEVRMGNAHAVQLSLNGTAYELDVPASTRLKIGRASCRERVCVMNVVGAYVSRVECMDVLR